MKGREEIEVARRIEVSYHLERNYMNMRALGGYCNVLDVAWA